MNRPEPHPKDRHARRWDDHWWKLCWIYGVERATEIYEGRDSATNADITKWRNLGTRTDGDL